MVDRKDECGNKFIENIESPIFVVGPPRSGTTLTAKILGNHSRIFMPGETHFFEDIYAQGKVLGDIREEKSRDKIIERLMSIYHRYDEEKDQQRVDAVFSNEENLMKFRESCTSYKNLFSTFMGIQLKEVGKKRWGNNTPRDVFYINEINSFFPDAKIIVSIRDPRDFLISYKERWQTASEGHMPRIKMLYHPIVTAILWKASVRRILRSSRTFENKAIHVIKYEQLVTNTESVVSELCEFIDESFEPEMLDIEANNSSIVGNEKGIFTSSIGRWKGGLGEEEVFIMQKIAGREMNALGYEVEKVSINVQKLISILFTFPGAALRGIRATAVMRGPLLPYVVRRIKSFLT